ncbi:MAG: helix-turn-helix transcriptional regulator [Ruminococcaceae bacterium]|nr:helix-turn-helix transcriptional regulator [Oscillospiraceae bacterium]
MKTRSKDYGNANVVGRCIERMRLQKGIKQSDFIAKLQSAGLDINPTSYSKLEGQLRQANDLELYYIAKVLNINIEVLFTDYVNVHKNN